MNLQLECSVLVICHDEMLFGRGGYHSRGSACLLYLEWSLRGAGAARGSIPGGNGEQVFTELYVLRKGQYMGVPSLNDLAVDGT